MKSSKGYLKDISLIRVFACIAVLLYHMNILKGGFLLVCTFFVLSGYLSCASCFKKEKFSLKEYYLNKLKHIYIPLLIVVFISIALTALLPNFNWLNLKPETNSVLLGYNNFWQLSANLDYFARHISSPFMHLWYMGIMLQFDLVFTFIFLGLRKLEDKFNKIVPCIVIFVLSILSMIFFLKSSIDQNIMFAYYNTFTRMFSILFGVLLAFIHHYYKYDALVVLNNKIMFYIYILILFIFTLFVDSKSSIFAVIMVLVTIISCRLIDYSIVYKENNLNIFDKIIKKISNISYEIYLVQYPIIFIFQYIKINEFANIILIIMLTILISLLLKYALNFKKTKLKIVALFVIIIISLFGFYKYLVSKDYSKEMKELEQKLEENSKLMEKQKEEYIENLKKEQENWSKTLEDLKNTEKNLGSVVENLSIVGIGDSVMLGAVDNLQEQFPNGYFDAAISRTAWSATDIINNLSISGLLGNPIIVNLGANGDCSESCKDTMMSAIGDREVFWLTVTNDNDVHFNTKLDKLAKKHTNIHIIDWNSISKGHSEYFYADGIHLTSKGRKAYTKAIYDSIYNFYLEKFKSEKEEIINEHSQKQNEKISFIGNSMLINAYEELQQNFPSSELITNSDYNFKLIKQDLENKINNNELNKKVVFVFDKSSKLNKKQYEQLIEMCKSHEIYIVSTDNKLKELEQDSVVIIDFYEELINNDSYLLSDGIHLTEKGNKELIKLIEKNLKIK